MFSHAETLVTPCCQISLCRSLNDSVGEGFLTSLEIFSPHPPDHPYICAYLSTPNSCGRRPTTDTCSFLVSCLLPLPSPAGRGGGRERGSTYMSRGAGGLGGQTLSLEWDSCWHCRSELWQGHGAGPSHAVKRHRSHPVQGRHDAHRMHSRGHTQSSAQTPHRRGLSEPDFVSTCWHASLLPMGTQDAPSLVLVGSGAINMKWNCFAAPVRAPRHVCR